MKYFLLLCILLPSSLLARKKTGQEKIDSLVNLLPGMKEDSNKVTVLSSIAFLNCNFNPDMGVEFGEKAVELAKTINWKPGLAYAYNCIGANYQIAGKSELAMTMFDRSLKIYEELEDKDNMAMIQGNMALSYASVGNNVKSLEIMHKTLMIYEELDNKKGIARMHANIGKLYDEQKNYSKALYHDTLALAIFQNMRNRVSVAGLLVNLGNVYSSLGNHDKGIIYLSEALSIYDSTGNKNGIARVLLNISTVYSAEKDPYKALEFQFRALKMYEEMGHELGIALSELNIAAFYGDIAEDAAEIKASSIVPASRNACLKLTVLHARKGIDILIKNNNLNELASAYKLMADAERLLGNYKVALENYLKYSKLNDSIFSIESNKKIQNLENQRELDLKESRIKILSQENNMKDLRAARDKQTRRALVGGIGMVVVIAVSLVMYYVRKQRNDKLIANERINTLLKEQELQSVSSMLEVQEQERKRIAGDLHDRLGSMLSTVKLYFNTVEEQIDNLKSQNKEQYHKATALLDEACDEVRKISHNLVSGELVKFGLVSALNQLKNTIEDTGKMKMNVFAFGMEERLDSTMEISLYRVVQELMNNMLKHAKATEVTIQLNRVDDNLNIMVEDNGVGFDVAAVLAKDGMGLRNMETRVKKMQGVISIDSGKGRGTTTIIDIPV
ncbi:MAG: sensor histidine kinase [Taibaiella sp.]|nr:sensor histidine kinase [Taibaiella sp.]